MALSQQQLKTMPALPTYCASGALKHAAPLRAGYRWTLKP